MYDLYARMVAQFIPKHIPGAPNVIVQNMPGVASMVAANYIYEVAKPDGLTIGSIQPALYFDQLVGRKEVKFDWQKFTWIGNTTVSHHLLYMRSDTPYKTIEDIRKASVPPKCGAEGTASSAYYLPKLLEETIGAKFNIVTGYNSGTDVDLAVERGEVQCRAFTIAAFFAREPFHTWRKKGFVRVIVQTGKKRDAHLARRSDPRRTHGPTQDSRLRQALGRGDFSRQRDRPSDRRHARHSRRPRENSPRGFHENGERSGAIGRCQKEKTRVGSGFRRRAGKLGKEIIAQPPDVIERMKKLLGT